MAARWVGLEGFKRLERLEGWQTADVDAHKKPLMCGPGVPVDCKSGHKKPLMCGAGWLLAAG